MVGAASHCHGCLVGIPLADGLVVTVNFERYGYFILLPVVFVCESIAGTWEWWHPLLLLAAWWLVLFLRWIGSRHV
jgi:hypothetical protein